MATFSFTFSPTSSPSFPPQNLLTSNSVQCCIDTRETPEFSSNGHMSFPEKNHLKHSTKILPPRPRRIILVRHGQSEGNIDEIAYTKVPDPKIALTEKGKFQAEECGERIRKMIENDGASDWKVYFYVSPYRRTRETLQHLARPFERSRIAGMREEPRLREQDFGVAEKKGLGKDLGFLLMVFWQKGNFQDREKMRVEKVIRKRYGRFFFRFPNGESAADVYDRITGFRETLRADIDIGRFQPPGERSPNMNLVIVSHGLTLRVFLMRWYKWSVDQYERLLNFDNGGMIVMEKGYGGRYSLLMHHTKEELRKFGLTDDMLMDQEWQTTAKPGELNYDCPMMNSFFTHFDDEEWDT